jgi:5-methylcytosine-specific restriction protein A
MHAKEWIEQFGRRRRSINAATLREVLQRQKKECTWCAAAVPPRRSAWCSAACVDAFLAIQISNVTKAVQKRDRGRCSLCGTETERLRRIVKLLRKWKEFSAVRDFIRHLKALGFNTGLFTVKRLWQADHILPVCEGGGLCGVEGFRTLCIPCHKQATRELAGRRRKAA